MAAADELKNYLHLEDMEEDSMKRMLRNVLDKIDEENADYVTTLLKADIDAFVAEKISPNWRNIITVLLCIRRQYTTSYLDDIIDDFNAMKNFEPEYCAGEAEGIPVHEAERLLKSVRTTTLRHFENNLRNSTNAIKTSIVRKHPHLAKPGMTVMLNDIIKASRHALYYKELKASVCGEAVTGSWKYETTLRLEMRMLSGVVLGMQQRHDALRHDFVNNFTKTVLACETKLKCMWCFRLASDAKTTHLPSHCTAYNQKALQQLCDEPMYIIIHAEAGYGVSDLILAFMLHEQQDGKEWVKLLPSGVTALKAKGITLHFFLQIDQCQTNIDKDSEEALRLETVTGIILDEFLMNNVKAFRVLQDTCQLIPLPPERRKEQAFPEFGYRDILLIKDMFQAGPADHLAPLVTNTFIYWQGNHRLENDPASGQMLSAIRSGNALLNQKEDDEYVTKYGKKKRTLQWCMQEDTKRNKYVGDGIAKGFPAYHNDNSSQLVCVQCTDTHGKTNKKMKKKKEAAAITQQNPFSTHTMGLCPGCLKPADVSKFSMDWRNRIRCTQNSCNAQSQIMHWFCVNCSKKDETKGEARRIAKVRFADCRCYATLLSERGQVILRCPQKACHGWKHFVGLNVPLRPRCRVCSLRKAIGEWHCFKCNISTATCRCRQPQRELSNRVRKRQTTV